MTIVKIEEWREYFAGEIEKRYGVDRGDARKRAEALIESLFGDERSDDNGDAASRVH